MLLFEFVLIVMLSIFLMSLSDYILSLIIVRKKSLSELTEEATNNINSETNS
jgi:hypothetical protein